MTGVVAGELGWSAWSRNQRRGLQIPWARRTGQVGIGCRQVGITAKVDKTWNQLKAFLRKRGVRDIAYTSKSQQRLAGAWPCNKWLV